MNLLFTYFLFLFLFDYRQAEYKDSFFLIPRNTADDISRYNEVKHSLYMAHLASVNLFSLIRQAYFQQTLSDKAGPPSFPKDLEQLTVYH